MSKYPHKHQCISNAKREERSTIQGSADEHSVTHRSVSLMLNNTDDLIVVTVKNQTYSDTSGDLRLGKAPESKRL